MDIILKKNIPGLGFKDEIVSVKNGYGRNYLIPNGLAVLANKSNSKILNENLKQTIKKQEEILKDAQNLAKKIGNLNLEFKLKTGSEERVFGSVTTAQISKMLLDKGFEIDKKNISILSRVNAVGEYEVELKIHKDLTHKIKVTVSGDKIISDKKKEKKKKTPDDSKPVDENRVENSTETENISESESIDETKKS